MRITTSELRRIIREEVSRALGETTKHVSSEDMLAKFKDLQKPVLVQRLADELGLNNNMPEFWELLSAAGLVVGSDFNVYRARTRH